MSARARRGALACCVVALVPGCGADGDGGRTVLSGLSQPRGLTADDTTVCVAEAGSIGPDGPAREQPGQLESDTGRVVCRELDDDRMTTVVDGLPFVYYPDAAVTSGAADVLRSGRDLFVLVGESYGPLARSVVALEPSGPRQVADLLAFAESTASATGGVLSNPYSFVTAPDRGGFLVADAATGTVLEVGLDGSVDTFATVPGHEVLTGMSWGPDGDLYVASFGGLPHPAGTGSIVALDATGVHREVVAGLTMAIDVAFVRSGDMLVLEYASPPDDPSGTDAYRDAGGRLSYVPGPDFDTEPVVLLDGLDRPTALAVAGDALWISLAAGEQSRGEGSVVRFALGELLER